MRQFFITLAALLLQSCEGVPEEGDLSRIHVFFADLLRYQLCIDNAVVETEVLEHVEERVDVLAFLAVKGLLLLTSQCQFLSL